MIKIKIKFKCSPVFKLLSYRKTTVTTTLIEFPNKVMGIFPKHQTQISPDGPPINPSNHTYQVLQLTFIYKVAIIQMVVGSETLTLRFHQTQTTCISVKFPNLIKSIIKDNPLKMVWKIPKTLWEALNQQIKQVALWEYQEQNITITNCMDQSLKRLNKIINLIQNKSY